MIWSKASECHHCKQWIEQGQEHDCWTTTEAALTEDLPEDLRDAWERLRESAAEIGDDLRIYASGTAIMFSRKSCCFFVRPRRKDLQLCVFLDRAIRAPQVRRAERRSTSKVVNIIHITHRDQVEAPITDWLREAYDLFDKPPATKARRRAKPTRARARASKRRARR